MAMTDMPWGLKPLFMAEARKTALIFPITNNYGTALFVNDPVVAVTGGTIERNAVSGACLGSILGIYKSTGRTSLRIESLVPQNYMSASPGASDTWFALVSCDPSNLYTIQEDGVTSSLVLINCFGMVDFIFTHTGNTITGISKAEIDSNTIDATATRPIQLVRPYLEWYDVDAESYNTVDATSTAGRNAKWIVRVANHQFNNASLSVGFA